MGYADVTTGLCQYVYYLSGVTPTAFGLVTGGSAKDTGDLQHRKYLGGGDRIVGGLVIPSLSLSFLPTGSDIIVTTSGLAWRSNATGYPCTGLADFDVFFGSSTEEVYSGAKINSMSLACGVGDPLSCQLELLATNKSEWALGTGAAVSGQHFEWYTAECTVNTTGVALQSFTFSMSNGLRPWTDMDTNTAYDAPYYYNRLPLRLVEGEETVRLEIRCGNKLAVTTRGNLADEQLVDLTFNAALTNSLGDTVAIDIAAMANASADHPMVVDGEVVYSYSFEAKNNPRSGSDVTVVYAPAPS